TRPPAAGQDALDERAGRASGRGASLLVISPQQVPTGALSQTRPRTPAASCAPSLHGGLRRPWSGSTRGGSTAPWRALRRRVYEEERGLCACGPPAVELDHILPVASG